MQVHIDLIALCIKKDRKALFELYKLCYADLMRICRRYTNAKEDAEDYMSTGFLKIIDNLSKYSNEKSFEPWAKKVMLHLMFGVVSIFADHLLKLGLVEATN